MALKDHVNRRETVALTDTTSFTVGALNAVIVVALASAHMDKLKRLFDAADARKLVDSPDPIKIVMLMMEVAPDVMAHAIALAAGEPDSIATVRGLSATTQLDAALKIFNLTFEAEGGIKKFGETVMALISLGNQALEAQKTNGIL